MRVALLSMPFLSPRIPSLGLTLIKGRLNQVFGDKLDVELFYLNHDFFRFFGGELYRRIIEDSLTTSINDWLFRQAAYEDAPDNTEEYFKRFYPGPAFQKFGPPLLSRLKGLDHFIAEVIDRYELSSFNVVGINNTFSIVPGMALCRHLKRREKEVVTVMGGASLYQDMGEAVIEYFPHVDYVCSGSGLVSFPELLRAILKGENGAVDTIPGMFSRNNIGRIGRTSEELDINTDIPLDYDDFFDSFNRFDLHEEYQPALLLETSRGCYWNRCKFCGLNEDQQRFRVKKVETAIRDINFLLEKYNCGIEVVDNVMPRHYIDKVFPYVDNPEHRFIVYEIRADMTDEEMEMLSRTGIRHVQPGIESLSTDIHQLMNKGVDAFQCLNLLKLCVKYGIFPSWNIIIGFPGMNQGMYEDLLALIPRVYHLFPPAVWTPVRFDRYSAYWRERDKYALNLVPFNAYHFVHPLDGEFIAKVAYVFEDATHDSERNRLIGEYYERIESAMNRWKRRWRSGYADGLPRLYCYVDLEGSYIYDSRHERLEEYRISNLGEDILMLLESPHTPDAIKSSLSGENPQEIDDTVAFLESRDLIFREKDQYMSLVIQDFSDIEFKATVKKFRDNPIKV